MRNSLLLKLSLPIFLLFVNTELKADSLNEWQKQVTKIAIFLTGNEQIDNTWKVEYNSKFNNIQPGSVLQALPNGSGMNVISKKCSIKDPDLISTEATNFGTAVEAGNFAFSTAALLPDFLSGSLAAANAGLRVDKSKTINYEFNNITVQQIDEATAIEMINSTACLNSIKHRSDVYMVRGVLNMQLSMSQGLGSDSNLGLSLKTINASKVGFNVGWQNQTAWLMEQNQPRPWFRIVTKFRLNKKENRYELVN